MLRISWARNSGRAELGNLNLNHVASAVGWDGRTHCEGLFMHSSGTLALFGFSLSLHGISTLPRALPAWTDKILMRLLSSKGETYEASPVAKGYAQNRYSIISPISLSQSSTEAAWTPPEEK